jgi:hypothetical protein
MLNIHTTAETSATPEAVIDAARDFSERRPVVWPNVKLRYLEVHARGETFAEVTEGAWIAGLFWERSRYEWLQPGCVKATVIDSNVFEPGSTWEIRAIPHKDGSSVEMLLSRGFRRGPKGRIGSALNHTIGKWWLWSSYLRHALAEIEKQAA